MPELRRLGIVAENPAGLASFYQEVFELEKIGEQNGAVFLSDGTFNLGFGGRYNHHSRFGNYATFELNPSYKFSDKVLLYAALTSGYNAPSLYQLFSPNADFNSGITRGNENLKPEKSLSAELGIKLCPNKNFNATISGFRTQVSNAIE